MTTAPLLRMARPDDGPAVATIYASWVRETRVTLEVVPPSGDQMAQRIARTLPRWPWVVAQEDDGVVGYACGGSYRTRDGYRWTVEVSAYVDGSLHRRGIGRRLYLGLLGLLVAQGHRQAVAGIGLPNPASVGFHEALGFTHVGTCLAVGRKFDDWQDVGWWQRPLGDGATLPPTEPLVPADLEPAVVRRILG